MCSLNESFKQRNSKTKLLNKREKSKSSLLALDYICDIDTLRTLIKKNKVRVVDVRKKEEYKKGHIKTAVSLPLAELLSNDDPDSIVKILNNLGISDDTPVVVYDDTFGALASRVAWSFKFVGHSNVALLEVTYDNWKKLGLEIERKSNKYPKASHSMNIDYSIYADAAYIENAQNDKNKIIIDSRERLNFLTEHIPNSKNIPYTMLRSENSILRSPSELKRFIENRGIDSNHEIITYCGSVGTLSGLTFFALKAAGISNVKLYPKSFKEWKSLGKPKTEFKDANYWDLSAE
ncbi:3-mercaptopyruvate sulfurtransferase [Candidatus Nitrosocosmicus franklandus]|uniref:3-mercaptopyruvate sulfurtransferase n=1 Tax=Candidatus Nitrosocosmicus franklandianus TaxID=1798806 RepID=A0A484I7Q8_9ARCH|nr:3-mercaptopyruvate sulfurtransferase [Candidatus Nitrosocosmicus franklandus]